MLLKVLEPAEQGQPHSHKRDPPPKRVEATLPWARWAVPLSALWQDGAGHELHDRCGGSNLVVIASLVFSMCSQDIFKYNKD